MQTQPFRTLASHPPHLRRCCHSSLRALLCALTPALAIALGLAIQLPATAQTLGEALNAPHLTWTTGGNANWFSQTDVTHDGVAAARSGLITHSQQTWVETIITGPGLLSFWWKVSSEDYDYLRFAINGILQDEISGEGDWQQQTYDLPAGTHTLRW